MMKHENSRRILLIDEDPAGHEELRAALATDGGRAGFEIDASPQVEAGLACISKAINAARPYSVVFINVRPGAGRNALDALQRIWREDPDIEAILLASSDESAQALLKGSEVPERLFVLKKPYDRFQLRQITVALAQKREMSRQASVHAQELENLVHERTRALQRAFSLLQATLDSTADGIFVADLAGRAVSFNEVFLRIWNIPMAKLGSPELQDDRLLTHGVKLLRNPAEFEQNVQQAIRQPGQEQSGTLEFRDGRVFEYRARPQRRGGEIVGRIWSFHDITRRRHAEDAVQGSEARFQLLFENNPNPIIIYDKTTLAFLSANEAALRHYGYAREEFLTKSLHELALPEEIPTFVDRLSKIDSTPVPGNSGVWRHRKKNGLLGEVEITSQSIVLAGKPAWLSLALDVTERLSLEAQLRQSQKMESVGQLAGGIAHDFNNLLTVINGHTSLLLMQPGLDPKAAERVREISEASRRAADLTRQLLAFSRKQELHPQVVDLNEVVNNITKMLRRILGEDILLDVNFSPNVPPVKADLGMLEQVLLNLAVNSRDAMPKGGQLRIGTSSLMIDAGYVKQNPEASPGRAVCLSFADTGCGIPPEHLSRIFEPFFTTKELDRGTGLGLATVYGIIKQHQGWIKVSSRLNEGTTFDIFLPASNQKPGEVTMSSAAPRVIGGTETILVVEDETPLRKLIQHILESYGYKVIEASTGVAALEAWELHSRKIDLLLSDLILPDGMSGQELAELLQKSKSGLKVVFMSGYDTQKLAKDHMLPTAATFLQKPFHARKLAETVYDCLAGKAA